MTKKEKAFDATYVRLRRGARGSITTFGVVPLREAVDAFSALLEARQGFTQYLRPFPNARNRGVCHLPYHFSAIADLDSSSMASKSSKSFKASMSSKIDGVLAIEAIASSRRAVSASS